MREKKPWRLYALHILDCMETISRILKRGDLLEDDILYHAALRNLQTLSEATQHLPDAFKTRHSEVPWKKITGFRNVLVHDYLGGISLQRVWDAIENNLPVLKEQVELMINFCDQGEIEL
jgi:uncharacterized protein with HEPN domain